jgi:hypothetical protein
MVFPSLNTFLSKEAGKLCLVWRAFSLQPTVPLTTLHSERTAQRRGRIWMQFGTSQTLNWKQGNKFCGRRLIMPCIYVHTHVYVHTLTCCTQVKFQVLTAASLKWLSSWMLFRVVRTNFTNISEVLTDVLIALMMEASGTSETSVKLYKTTWCNIPDDSYVHTVPNCDDIWVTILSKAFR